MDELFDQGIHSSVGNTPDAESASRACGATPIPDSQLTQEEMEAATIEPAFAKKVRYWSQRLSKTIGDRSMGEEDHSQEIFFRVMKEWKRTRAKRPDYVFVPTRWVKSIAYKIIREAKAQKRAHEKIFLSIFGGPDGRLIDTPDQSTVPDELKAFVLDESTKRFSGKKLEIILLLREDLTYQEIQAQLEERWNPGTQGRSDPDFKKCPLGTISNVRKEFIGIAQEIYEGVRLS